MKTTTNRAMAILRNAFGDKLVNEAFSEMISALKLAEHKLECDLLGKPCLNPLATIHAALEKAGVK